MLHPEFTVVHINDSLSRLYFKINTSELLYTKKGENEDFQAKFAITYVLFQSYEANSILDSSSLVVQDGPIPAAPKDIIGFIEFDTFGNRRVLLEAKLRDLNRNQTARTFLNVDKTSLNSRQNFFVKVKGDKNPLLQPFVNSDETLVIKHKYDHIKNLIVRYYDRAYDLAPPPFSVADTKPLDYRADSIFTIPVGKAFSPIKQGFYHIQADTLDKQGYTIFRYADEFPKMSTYGQMLEPLRYLTTKQEFDKIVNGIDLKKSVDEFWIDLAGNRKRAKELIRKFYNRVQDSNQFFTSFVEGWKSDRGLIYLIYGPPNVVYKNSINETWVYGEENNMMSLNFTFYRVSNPFTDEDYALSRSPIYKSSWYRAVDTWRRGRVYTDN